MAKRNIRVLTITGVLLFLVYFIVQNANTAQLTVNPLSSADTKSTSKSEINTDEKVSQEIDSIKQEVGITVDANLNSASKVDDTSKTTFDAAKEYATILKNSPMIVFSKSRCPYSAKLKELLKEEYVFTPDYAVVELDMHKHGAKLQEYISTTTGRSTVPNVIINGVSRGGFDDLNKMHSKGTLLDNLKEWSDKSLTVIQNEKPSNN